MRDRESLPSLLMRPQLAPATSSRLSAAQLSTENPVISTETATPPTPSRQLKREPRLRRAVSNASLAGPSLSTVSSDSALGSFAAASLALPQPSSASTSPSREPLEASLREQNEEATTKDEQDDAEVDSEAGSSAASEVSSDFAALLARTGAKRPPSHKSAKARGKQREQQPEYASPIPARIASALEGGSVKSDDSSSLRLAADDEDDPGELVRWSEGLSGTTASDSLRAFQAGLSERATARTALAFQRRQSGTAAKPLMEEGPASLSLSSSQAELGKLAVLYPPRRYFVLSSAGKLIFTTDGEEEATTLVGVIQAIVSIFADESDRIRYIDAGPTRIAFLLKAPLYLCVVSGWGEPESILRMHLLHLHMLILSIVTLSQLTAIFNRRANFDLRRMLEGTEPFFERMLGSLESGFGEMTTSLDMYRLESPLREEVAKSALQPCKVPDTLYALLVSSGRIVNVLKPRKHTIHATDLHLLLCHLPTPPPGEPDPADASWLPVCLPRFNPRGFLHAYVSWASDRTAVVLVCGDKDAVGKAKDWCDGVKDKLKSTGADGVKKKKSTPNLLERIERSKAMQDYSLAELGIPGLRHFLYKTKAYVQITHPAFEDDYAQPEHRRRLVTLYQLAWDAVHAKPAYSGSARPPAKLVYYRTEHEAVLGWTTASFELYMAVSPLLPKSAVVSAARAVLRWIQKRETSLFLMKSFEL